ncbi:MAG: hypothetical protein Q7S56_02445 [Nanoarchaeota archaeon]|nr:hypothetical protein [Nanoarchaeota archaeon]
MNKNCLDLNQSILERWAQAAALLGVITPSDIKVKIVRSKDSSYKFGVILNEKRFNRPSDINGNYCKLCRDVEKANEDVRLNLSNGTNLGDMIVIINKYPIFPGFSLAVPSPERVSYSTSDLSNLKKDLERLLPFSDETGLELCHNQPGLGATIPLHDHWHLTNFKKGFEITNESYGFNAAEVCPTLNDPTVSYMPDFPFAHLIFNKKDTDKLLNFLQKLGEKYGNKYINGKVPHDLSGGRHGFLVSIGRDYFDKSWSSSEFSGNIIAGNENEFNRFSYEDCVNGLKRYFLTKKEIELETLL